MPLLPRSTARAPKARPRKTRPTREARARQICITCVIRALGLASALIWTVIWIGFVLWVVARATATGTAQVFRSEWKSLNRPAPRRRP